MNSSIYDHSTTRSQEAEGAYESGGTTMSFKAEGNSSSSGNGTYLATSGGTFGPGGANVTTIYASFETGSDDWLFKSQSERADVHDDGKGNSGNAWSKSSAGNDGDFHYTNTVDSTEWIIGSTVTSLGTMTHTGSGSGSSFAESPLGPVRRPPK